LIYISGSQAGDEDFVVLCNLSGSQVAYTVPAAPAGTHWVRLIDTSNWAESFNNCWSVSDGTIIGSSYNAGNQSLVVLEAVANSPAP
jgi:hypothetical protein